MPTMGSSQILRDDIKCWVRLQNVNVKDSSSDLRIRSWRCHEGCGIEIWNRFVELQSQTSYICKSKEMTQVAGETEAVVTATI